MKLFVLDRTNNSINPCPHDMDSKTIDRMMADLLESPILNQWCEHNCFTQDDSPLCMCGKNLIAFGDTPPMLPRWWKHELLLDGRVKSTPQYGSFNRTYGQVYADTNKIYCATPNWSDELPFTRYKRIFLMKTRDRTVSTLPRYMEYNFKLNRFNGVKDWIPGDCFCEPSCDNFMSYATFYGYEAPRMPLFFHHEWDQNKQESKSSMRYEGEMVREWRIDANGTWHMDEDRSSPSIHPPGFPAPNLQEIVSMIMGVRR